MSFSKINQHCAKLLLILTKLRGAYAVASEALQEDWIKNSWAECGVELQLGTWFNYINKSIIENVNEYTIHIIPILKICIFLTYTRK